MGKPRFLLGLLYFGTVLLAVAATSLVLLTTLGGSVYPWGSAPIFILAILAGIFIICFIFIERRAAEPVLPLELFRNAVFTLSCWLLFRIQEQVPTTEANLAERLQVPIERLAPSIERLMQNGLVSLTSQSDGQGSGQLQLTTAGQQAGTRQIICCLSQQSLRTSRWLVT